MTKDTLPPLFLKSGQSASLDEGPRCLRCGQKIKGTPIQMYRDWRTDEFHDFGEIPEKGAPRPFPDGPYDVGPECAGALRKRARAAMQALGIKL